MGSYRTVQQRASISALVEDGFAALGELGDECQEIVDNASDGLARTDRISRLSDTAGSLTGFSEPTLPEGIESVLPEAVAYTEQVQTRRGRGTSRAVRCSNACTMLQAAADALEAAVDNDGVTEEMRAEMEQCATDCREIADEAEALEFPGMFG